MPASANEVLLGFVVSVLDGDTIIVLDASNVEHRVRLSGIDAPEKAQPFGSRSKAGLAQLVFNKNVSVEWKKRDRYGRIVGKVLVEPPDCPDCPKTVDAGLAQVSLGMAWWYKKYAKEQALFDRSAYERAEFEASARRLGLWSDTNPVPPWEWRQRRNGAKKN